MQGSTDDKAHLSRTTGTDTPEERTKARPDANDVTDPKEVWKDGETEPSRDRAPIAGSGAPGRVADAGDVGGHASTPYEQGVQSDSILRQDNKKTGGIEKPRKG